jgi:arginase family enzyme
MTERAKRPAYTSGVTFLNCPAIDDAEITSDMVVVGGVPCEFTGSSIGPRLGPSAIRSASIGIDWRFREPGPDGVVDVLDGSLIRFRDDLALGDVGDFTIYAPQLEPTTASIIERQEAIVGRGAFPVMLGGDHYVSYPLAAGYHAAKRAAGEQRIGYIQVDAHFDLQDQNPTHGPVWHGSNARRVAELDGFNPENMVWLGLLDIAWRDEWEFAQCSGATVVTIDQMRAEGIEQTVARALEIAGRDCDSIYMTIDIDSVDSSAAPGTGYINFGGLTSAEFLRTMRALGASKKAGGIDLVEVTPPNDVRNITAYLAARGLVEFLRDRLFDPRVASL